MPARARREPYAIIFPKILTRTPNPKPVPREQGSHTPLPMGPACPSWGRLPVVRSAGPVSCATGPAKPAADTSSIVRCASHLRGEAWCGLQCGVPMAWPDGGVGVGCWPMAALSATVDQGLQRGRPAFPTFHAYGEAGNGSTTRFLT